MSEVKNTIFMVKERCGFSSKVELYFEEESLTLSCDIVFEKISIIKKDKLVFTNVANGALENNYPLGLLLGHDIQDAKEL